MQKLALAIFLFAHAAPAMAGHLPPNYGVPGVPQAEGRIGPASARPVLKSSTLTREFQTMGPPTCALTGTCGGSGSGDVICRENGTCISVPAAWDENRGPSRNGDLPGGFEAPAAAVVPLPPSGLLLAAIFLIPLLAPRRR